MRFAPQSDLLLTNQIHHMKQFWFVVWLECLIFVLSSNSQIVSFIAGTNGGSQVLSALDHGDMAANTESSDKKSMLEDKISFMEIRN